MSESNMVVIAWICMPNAIVRPYGVCFAYSGSTWIGARLPVASAK